MKKFILHLSFFLTCFFSFAQESSITLSKKASISILTCEPGQNELYSVFGHSAIRVKDPLLQIDWVYNYGTFNFDTPNFYLKFCRGQLPYEVNKFDFKYFPYPYARENRWVKEQIINLTFDETQNVFDFLEWNALPENKQYYYDFFYDNCATKMYSVLEKVIPIKYHYNTFPKDLTYRELLHQYLPSNTWYRFGINLALGSVIDHKASYKKYLFLPDYIFKAFESAYKLDGTPLVKTDSFILPDYNKSKAEALKLTNPLIICLLFLILLSISLITKKVKLFINLASVIYGVLGIIIALLWFLTEHSATKLNFNILWANPLLIMFPLLKSYRKLFIITGGIGGITFLIVSIFKIQFFDLPVYLLAIGSYLIQLNRYQK